MTPTQFSCPVCRALLPSSTTDDRRCLVCDASFRFLNPPSASTLSLPISAPLHDTVDQTTDFDPNATVDQALTVTHARVSGGVARDDRAPLGYEIEGELGRGGMGVVYRARQTKLDRVCALKMILAGGHAGETERERFLTEAQAIARLQHPGIVQVFEVGEHQGHPFMALELCAGGALDKRLRDRPPTPREAAEMVRALALSMQAAHDASVIHRDLKPGNVLIAADGTFKITDFGLAKKLDEDGRTHTGAVMGTPSYMPPEQAQGRNDLGPAVDIYALGAILYSSLTGRPPFRGATAMETLLQVVENEPVAVRALNPATPRDLETICHKCLQKDPAKRYASAQDLARDLDRFLTGEPIAARPVGAMERGYRWVRRNPVVAALTAATLFILVVGVVASWTLTLWALDQTEKANNRTTRAVQAERDSNDRLLEAASEKARADQALAVAEMRHYAGQLARAQWEWQTGSGFKAIELLEQTRWDLRGIEHRLLWTQFRGDPILLAGYGEGGELAFSRDGKRIATSQNSRVRVSDATTGQEVFSVPIQRIPQEGRASQPVQQLHLRRVALSPNGHRVALGYRGSTGVTRIWDTGTGRELGRIETARGGGEPLAFAWSLDGKRLLVGEGDRILGKDEGKLRVWDVDAGKEVLAIQAHPRGGAWMVAWHPDARRFVSFGEDSLKVWDVATKKALFSLPNNVKGNTFELVSWSPDGSRIATTTDRYGGSSGLNIWDARDGTPLPTPTYSSGRIKAVAWSPDGKQFACGNWDGLIQIWESETGRDLFTLRRHPGLRDLAWSSDGSQLRSAANDGSIRVWDITHPQQPYRVENDWGDDVLAQTRDGTRTAHIHKVNNVQIKDSATGRVIHTLEWLGGGPVSHASFSPDGGTLLVQRREGFVNIWDTVRGEIIRTFKAHGNGFAWTADSRRFLIQSERIQVWDARDHELIVELPGHSHGTTSAAWNPSGTQVATGERDHRLKIWDAELGKELRSLSGHTGVPDALAWSDDGSRILSGARDKTLRLWDSATGEQLLVLNHAGGDPMFVAFDSDHRIVARVRSGEKLVWETTQSLLKRLGGSSGYYHGSFRGEGKVIATADPHGAVQLLDTRTGEELRSLRVRDAKAMAWSPDGKRLVTAGEKQFDVEKTSPGKLLVWNAETGEQQLDLKGHVQSLGTVDWSPDGRAIAAGGDDNRVRVWDAESGAVLLTLEGHESGVGRLAWSPGGDRLLTVDGVGVLRVWNATDGKAFSSWKLDAADAGWSPDGKQILVGDKSGKVRVVSAETSAEALVIPASSQVIYGVAWSHNGRFLAATDGVEVWIWEAASGRLVASIKTTGYVRNVVFSPDDRTLLMGNRLWDFPNPPEKAAE